MTTYKYRGFNLILDEPIVIAQGDTWEKEGWGPFQFPSLTKTRDGFVRYSATGANAIESIEKYTGEKGTSIDKISEDGGLTWRDSTDADITAGIRLPNGHEYFKPKAVNAYEAAWLEKYTPDACGKDLVPETAGKDIDSEYFEFGIIPPDFYSAEKIPEFPKNPEAYDYDPLTDTTETFRMQVNWPHLAIVTFTSTDRSRTLVYPFENVMGIKGHVMVDPDGTLFCSTYHPGFSAETGEPDAFSIVTVLRSDDYGRTWNYQSEIQTPPQLFEEYPDGFDSFSEPCIARMQDGSVIMLIRLGSGIPSFITRSTDNCKTWSEPVIFDRVGILPRICCLNCGITLATYGRLGVYLRATSDEHGLEWEVPIDMDVPKSGDGSCCNNSLIALDDTTALIAYSHFKYPNEDGVPVKTLLVRKIHIEME